MPPIVTWGAENAAHRIAVEWDAEGETRVGVFVPERHSASWLPVVAGGRVFPGIHRRASFDVRESADRISVTMDAGPVRVAADVRVSDGWSSELFPTLQDASDFFRAGDIGFSLSRSGARLQALQLRTSGWRVDAAEPIEVRSDFFDALPAGSAELDDVLVMRDVPVRWQRPPAGSVQPPASASAMGTSPELKRTVRR